MKITAISVDSHESVSLSVTDFGSEWTVDWDLFVVSTKSVSVGISITEKSALEHLVHRWLHAWNKVGWGKSRLFSFLEVVGDVLVENQSTDWDQWVVSLGNDLGDVEDVPFVLETIHFWNGLDVQIPFSSLSLVQMINQISGSVVRF